MPAHKLDPGLRANLPEVYDLVAKLMPAKTPVYRVIAEHWGVSASLVQTYVLGERQRRAKQSD